MPARRRLHARSVLRRDVWPSRNARELADSTCEVEVGGIEDGLPAQPRGGNSSIRPRQGMAALGLGLVVQGCRRKTLAADAPAMPCWVVAELRSRRLPGANLQQRRRVKRLEAT